MRKHTIATVLIAAALLVACDDTNAKDKVGGQSAEVETSTVTTVTTTVSEAPQPVPSGEASEPAAVQYGFMAPAKPESEQAPAPEPAPEVVEPPASHAPPAAPQGKPSSCDEARAWGIAPMTSDSPYYSKKLDRDGDGIACDQTG